MEYQHLNHHWSVEKFFKGVFNLRPPLPKLSFVWDVQIMLKHFMQLGDNMQLSDKHLSQKTLNSTFAFRKTKIKFYISF